MEVQLNTSVQSDTATDRDIFGVLNSDSDDDLVELIDPFAVENAVQKMFWIRSQICLEIKSSDAHTDLKKCCEKIFGLHFNDNERVMRNIRKTQGSIKASDIFNKHTILRWGERYKIVPHATGISTLIISCIVVDDCLGVDDLREAIMELLGDDCQSVDVMSVNTVSEL